MYFNSGDLVIYSQGELFDTELVNQRGSVVYNNPRNRKPFESYSLVDFGPTIGTRTVPNYCLDLFHPEKPLVKTKK